MSKVKKFIKKNCKIYQYIQNKRNKNEEDKDE